jgi:hypothetical protein
MTLGNGGSIADKPRLSEIRSRRQARGYGPVRPEYDNRAMCRQVRVVSDRRGGQPAKENARFLYN